MHLWAAYLTFVGCLSFAGAAYASSSGQCLNGLGPTLLAGGFSGSIDCQHDRLSIMYVGSVQKFGRAFQVYSYLYQLHPACQDCAIHGGQRVVFLERGRYVGQYKPDFVRVVMRHGDLVFMPTDSDPGGPITVQFTPDGPPKQLWVGGEVISFFK